MADDTTKQPGDEKKADGPARDTQPGAADDLDIDIDAAPVTIRRRGGGLVWLVLALIVVAAVAAFFVYNHEKTRREQEAAEAQAKRIETYEAQMNIVTQNVAQAIASAEEGRMDEAIRLLTTAENQLTILARQANTADDQQWASIAMNRKQTIIDARQTISEGYEAYREVISKEFGSLQSKFGLAAGAAPVEEGVEEAETADTPEEPEADAADDAAVEAAEPPPAEPDAEQPAEPEVPADS